MDEPLKLTIVMTHPVQYFAPWFRHIASTCPALDVTVLYGAIPSAEQQGTGFGRPFLWDVPLLTGYRYVVCDAAVGRRFGRRRLLGADVADIGERIAATNPDVVLVPGWHALMERRALRACRKRRIPVLYRGDSTLFSGPRRVVRPLWVLRTRLMLRLFDAYLSVGSTAREYLQAFDIPEQRIFQSPHCVDNARFTAAAERLVDERPRLREAIGAGPDDFVVFFAGKLIARKRPLDAVRAVAGLGKSAMLVVAGDGPLAGDVRAEAARLGIRMNWRGFLNQSELPAAFAASDCVVVPSTWETWGLIVNEALASGVPCVVTSQVPAGADLIRSGETGYCVSVGDVAAVTASLAAVRAARERGVDFSAACRERVATHSFDTATTGLLAACRMLAGETGIVRGPQNRPIATHAS